MPPSPLKLAVLVSGSGTTLQNFVDVIAAGKLDATIGLVIGSRPGLLGLKRAADANLPSFVVDRRSFDDCAAFSKQIFSLCDDAGADLVCLAGWLCLLDLPARYAGRVMNIHPALLPSFGGKGMFGRKVHQAVIDHGCKVSGCTVHFVDNTYDTGPIILQRTCPVLDEDTPEALAHRVFEEEKIAYPQAVGLFRDGRLRVEGRRVRVREDAPGPGAGGASATSK
jgi:phosphoribosylglycinamide formyltransferase-1